MISGGKTNNNFYQRKIMKSKLPFFMAGTSLILMAAQSDHIGVRAEASPSQVSP